MIHRDTTMLIDRPVGFDQHAGESASPFEWTDSDFAAERWIELVGEFLALTLHADASTDLC